MKKWLEADNETHLVDGIQIDWDTNYRDKSLSLDESGRRFNEFLVRSIIEWANHRTDGRLREVRLYPDHAALAKFELKEHPEDDSAKQFIGESDLWALPIGRYVVFKKMMGLPSVVKANPVLETEQEELKAYREVMKTIKILAGGKVERDAMLVCLKGVVRDFEKSESEGEQ